MSELAIDPLPAGHTQAPAGNFRILPVRDRRDLEHFLDVPAWVYRDDPLWVPPLRSAIAKQFAPQNPFFAYGCLQAWVALDGQNRAIGRIVAAINLRLIDKEEEPIGLFGFFECVQDAGVAAALFAAAEAWLVDRGIRQWRGPIDLSTHNNCLLLVEGFDTPPMVMMPYNPPYYGALIEAAGFAKAKDAYAYDISLEGVLPSQFAKGYRIALEAGVTFRNISLKGEAFDQDCRRLYRLFTKAFERNWSSTPRSEEEFLEESRSLQTLVDPDVFPIAEYQGEMVGFFMGLPDYNIPLKQVGGKLDIWGTLKFLYYRRQIDRGRVLVICSLPEYQRKMVPLGLVHLGFQGCTLRGKPYKRAELGWIYEDNWRSRKIVETSGAKISKTYRIYQKNLA